MADDPPALDVASTALFVELVVIGCGMAGALSLGASAAFGWGWLSVVADAGPLVVFVLAGVYVLGIVTDRLADAIGEPWSTRWRTRLYRRRGIPPESYHVDLTLVLHDVPLSSRLAYGRSRLRVVRGWTLDCVVGLGALVAYAVARPDDRPVGKLVIGLSILLLALGGACVFAWRRLALAQFEHVAEQACALRRP